MKIHELKCPNCQALLSLQEDKVRSQIVYCPYCGNKMVFDDEVKRYEYTHNINIKKETHVFDETKISQSLAEKAKYEAEAEKSKTDVHIFKFLAIFFAMWFIWFGCMLANDEGYFDGIIPSFLSSFDKHATIAVPFSSSELKNSTSNYTYYVNELNNAGFTNIKTHENPDIVWGFTKEGTIDTISINGHTSFKIGNKFRPDADIIVSYHVKSK